MIIIEPLINLLRVILDYCYYCSGSYGVAIILLSVAVNILMLPLFLWADKLREREQIKQRQMAPELAKIATVSNSQKRYYYTRRIYRQFGYHPAHALLGLLGLFIQIPLFIAAYWLLGHYPGFQQVAWGPIHNLAGPDQLLHIGSRRLNLLPFLMAAVNIAGIAACGRRISRSEKLQLLLLALLFLLLLYRQPAAMLIYWTMNNLLALLRTLLFRRELPSEQPLGTVSQRGSWRRLPELLRGHALPALLLLAVNIAYGLLLLIFSHLTPGLLTLLLLGGAAIVLGYFVSAVFAKYRPMDGARLWGYGLLAMLVILLAAVNLAPATVADISDFSRRSPLLLLVTLFVLFCLTLNRLLLCCRSFWRDMEEMEWEGSGKVTLLVWLLLLAMVMFYLPLHAYNSSPLEFTIPVSTILRRNLLELLPVLLLAGLAWYFTAGKRRLHTIAAWGSTAMLIFSLANGVIWRRNFGPMSFFVFDDGVAASPERAIFEYIMAVGSFAVAFWLLKYYRRSLIRALLILNFLFGVKFIYNFTHPQPRQAATKYGSSDERQLLTFSRHGKNILFLILDMFPGGFVAPLLHDNPEYYHIFSGFVWYPNTISVTNLTYYTIPVFNGGMEFSPEELAKRDSDLDSETTRSYEKLFTALQDSDYQVSCVTHSYYQGKLLPTLRKFHIPGVTNRYFIRQRLAAGMAMDKIYHRLLRNIALLVLTPSFMNDYLYNDGAWNVVEEQRVNWTLPSLAALRALGSRCSIVENGNTFKRWHNSLSHVPYLLDSDGRLADNPSGMGKEELFKRNAYATMQLCFKLLVPWINWLKRNGIYDNTKIILISDHSNERHDIPAEFVGDKKFPVSREVRNRLHPLLMVKPFNSHGRLRIDYRFMSNADAAAIIASELTHPALLTTAPDPSRSRPPECRILPAYWLQGEGYVPHHLRYEKYLVTNSIFDPKGWVRVK